MLKQLVERLRGGTRLTENVKPEPAEYKQPPPALFCDHPAFEHLQKDLFSAQIKFDTDRTQRIIELAPTIFNNGNLEIYIKNVRPDIRTAIIKSPAIDNFTGNWQINIPQERIKLSKADNGRMLVHFDSSGIEPPLELIIKAVIVDKLEKLKLEPEYDLKNRPEANVAQYLWTSYVDSLVGSDIPILATDADRILTNKTSIPCGKLTRNESGLVIKLRENLTVFPWIGSNNEVIFLMSESKHVKDHRTYLMVASNTEAWSTVTKPLADKLKSLGFSNPDKSICDLLKLVLFDLETKGNFLSGVTVMHRSDYLKDKHYYLDTNSYTASRPQTILSAAFDSILPASPLLYTIVTNNSAYTNFNNQMKELYSRQDLRLAVIKAQFGPISLGYDDHGCR